MSGQLCPPRRRAVPALPGDDRQSVRVRIRSRSPRSIDWSAHASTRAAGHTSPWVRDRPASLCEGLESTRFQPDGLERPRIILVSLPRRNCVKASNILSSRAALRTKWSRSHLHRQPPGPKPARGSFKMFLSVSVGRCYQNHINNSG